MIMSQQTHVPKLRCHTELGQLAILARNITGVASRLLDNGQCQYISDIHTTQNAGFTVLDGFRKVGKIGKSRIAIAQCKGRVWIKKDGEENCKQKACIQSSSEGLIFERHGFSFSIKVLNLTQRTFLIAFGNLAVMIPFE